MPGEVKKNKVVVNHPAPSGQYGDKGARKNKQQRTKESTKRQAMLNTHRINPFKYDMKRRHASPPRTPRTSSRPSWKPGT